MSFWQRISTDANNAANDVYSHWILGDDAGKSALTTFIYRPNLKGTDDENTNQDPESRSNPENELGMTFIEINRRAYVKSVQPNSIAHRAGVLPQDAIQLAIPIRQQWELDAMKLNGGGDDDDGNANNENDDSARIKSIDRIARTYGLKLEKKGARTSYNQLVRLLSRHVYYCNERNEIDPASKMKQHFLSPLTKPLTNSNKKKSLLSMLSLTSRNDTRNDSYTHYSATSAIGTTNKSQQQPWDEPPTPSKLCGPILLDVPRKDGHAKINDDDLNDHDIEFQNSYLNFDRKHSASTEHSEDDDEEDYDNDDDMYLRSSSHPPPSGILFIFRRTRQRQVSQETASCFVPASFRLDDECDLACTLVRRLAPTADMEAPIPDTWEELVHDGTDWLLGHSSMLPPKGSNTINSGSAVNSNIGTGSDHVNDKSNYYAGSSLYTTDPPISSNTVNGGTTTTTSIMDNNNQDHNSIPLDAFEQTRAKKLATLRSRITTETMLIDRTDDVEAATVRAMIQKAVGLAFVRASKIVLGVSIHGGSGIVISRLPDGTWSAPSAIGTWGLGLGLQFGLEVAEYIFILQTQEAMQHFKRGGSYTVGGNMGIAIGGLGREAYGAASVGGGVCGTDTTLPSSNSNNNTSSATFHDEDYNDDNDDSNEGSEQLRKRDNNHRVQQQPARSLGIAPIVAYAKSQGLYVGVSLEGSRIFTRNDINCRTYKFSSGRDVTADDILSGKVPTPPEAEELYAALHSVEFTHEMSRLPRPPEVLRNDSANAWNYDRSISISSKRNVEKSQEPTLPRRQHQFSFLSDLSSREADECTTFEAHFKNFLYGGVSVQRLIVDTGGGSDRTGKERRTLWLMLPEVGSLRIGFVSKLSDGEGAVSNKISTQRTRRDDSNRTMSYGDNGTVGSEELTLDSALITKVSAFSFRIQHRATTNLFSQFCFLQDGSTIGPIRQGNVQLSESHSVALTDVISLSQEPTVQIRFKGEDKTQHLRVISIQDVSGTNLLFLANNFREAELLVCGLKLLLERETTRLGVRGGLPISALGGRKSEGAMSPAAARGFREIMSTTGEKRPANASSRNSNDSLAKSRQAIIEKAADRKLKAGNWGKQPGRDYMRGQASSGLESIEVESHKDEVPFYAHGQPIIKTIATDVRISLPIPLCRVLLLDSTSPVIAQWQQGRGDCNFDHSQWLFPPATPRELERHESEHQLIASGSMCGAERSASFDRSRYGSFIRLTETYTVDTDDPKRLSLFIIENSPRRGFATKVKILLRATKDNLCEASAIADIRPVGKDMSNQAAVHKAYLLVLEEIKLRYGIEQSGLLNCFLSVVDEMASSLGQPNTMDIGGRQGNSLHRLDSNLEEKKSDFQSPGYDGVKASGLVSFEDMLRTGRESPEIVAAPRPETPCLNLQIPEANPAKRLASKLLPISDSGEFAAVDAPFTKPSGEKNDSVLIEVKPLPKIRLALMPSPREEDEDTSSSKSPFQPKPIKKKKKKSSSTSKSDSKRSSTRLSTSDLKRHVR
jgi:lipid-binding SYLF domain-containing protein